VSPDRRNARLCQGREIFGLREIEVVGRSAPQIGGEKRSTRSSVLLRVDLRGEPGLESRFEHPACVVSREVPFVAEHVGELREPPSGDLRYLLRHDLLDVGGPVHLRRHIVRAHERADEFHRMGLVKAPIHLQQLDLIRRRKPVATLALDRGRTVREHFVEPRHRRMHQIVFRGCPRRLDRGQDSHGNAQRHRLFSRPGEARGVLADPRAPEYEVGVGVHESGSHDSTTGVDYPGPCRVYHGPHLGFRTDRDHRVSGNRHGSTGDASDRIVTGSVAGEHLRGAHHEEIDRLTLRSVHRFSPAAPFPAPARR
jgi:hypothetical protein